MTVLRMDNVLLVVNDMQAAIDFFTELGLELEGESTVEGESVDRLLGLEGSRSQIAMMRTPDGHGRIELDKFVTPAAVRAEPEDAPVNALGIRRIMFAVEDIDDVVGRLRARGAELIGEVVQYGDEYRLAYIRGPEGIMLALAEAMGDQSASPASS
jgi:catechol 2,3-dioxygenase-like lactoylglutathione lyase family enzyme